MIPEHVCILCCMTVAIGQLAVSFRKINDHVIGQSRSLPGTSSRSALMLLSLCLNTFSADFILSLYGIICHVSVHICPQLLPRPGPPISLSCLIYQWSVGEHLSPFLKCVLAYLGEPLSYLLPHSSPHPSKPSSLQATLDFSP